MNNSYYAQDLQRRLESQGVQISTITLKQLNAEKFQLSTVARDPPIMPA